MKTEGRASPSKTRRSPSSSPRKNKKKAISPKATHQPPPASPPRSPTAIQKAIAHSSVFTIWYAAQHGKRERIQSILDRQAVASIDVQEYRTKWSALHFAARFGQTEIVQLLVDRGADPNLLDATGHTPLHLSAGWGNLRCTVLLLEAGAFTPTQNERGQTALDVATALARDGQVRVLTSWQPLELSAEDLLARRTSRASIVDVNARLVSALQSLELQLRDEVDPLVRQLLHALVAKTQSHGDTDASLLPTLDTLCGAYRTSDRLELALATAERALLLAETLCGRDAVVTLAWLNNASELLLALQRVDESYEYLEQAYRGYEAAYGPSDATTLDVLENLANVTVQRHDVVTAERLLKELLARRLALTDGGWNERIFELEMQLGVAVLAQKRVGESEAIFRDCLTYATSAFGSHHDATRACVEQLGRCAFVRGDLEASERLFTESLRGALSQEAPTRDAAHHRRLHNNLAMLAIARKSADAVARKLQDGEYRYNTGIEQV